MIYLGKSVVKEMHVGAKPELFRYAKEMRKNPTLSEKNDDGRSAELEKYGLNIIRFTNDQVLKETDNDIFQIQDYIARLTSPSPPGEGDKRG